MLLEHLKNSLNTFGKPTKYPRTYNLREDGRHEVFWVGSTGVKAQAIYSEYNPDGTRTMSKITSYMDYDGNPGTGMVDNIGEEDWF